MKARLTIPVGPDTEYIEKLVAQYNASLPSDTGFRRTMFALLINTIELPETLTLKHTPDE